MLGVQTILVDYSCGKRFRVCLIIERLHLFVREISLILESLVGCRARAIPKWFNVKLRTIRLRHVILNASLCCIDQIFCDFVEKMKASVV